MICDHYMKCLTVRYNKISKTGIEKLCMGVSSHKDYIGLDFRHNPGYNKTHKNLDPNIMEVLKLSMLRNIRENVIDYKTIGKRLKLEWIFPYILGINDNNLDEKGSNIEGK